MLNKLQFISKKMALKQFLSFKASNLFSESYYFAKTVSFFEVKSTST